MKPDGAASLPMRVAQVTPVYPPYQGGMGQVARQYTDRLRRRGHDVVVFVPRHRGVTEPRPHVHHVPAILRRGNAALLPSLRARVRDFDLVHVHYPFFGGVEPLMWTRNESTVPVVLSYHMDPTADGLKGTLFDLHRRIVQPTIMSRARRLLVSSRDYFESSQLATIGKLSGRVEVHAFGVDSERFSPGSGANLRARLGLEAASVVLLFVGGLDAAHAFKGLDVLFEALSHLLTLRWHLVIVGDGGCRPWFERAARKRGLTARVTFTGHVTDDLLPSYYRAADIHVLPSTTRSEAFGLVTLEAAATGIPSIVSDLPGVRSNVVDGHTGLLVPPGDAKALRHAIRDLVDAPERRQRLGGAARARVVREFTWEPLIDRLEETYRAVLPGH